MIKWIMRKLGLGGDPEVQAMLDSLRAKCTHSEGYHEKRRAAMIAFRNQMEVEAAKDPNWNVNKAGNWYACNAWRLDRALEEIGE
jgi:hypothetical protein